jgi:hypothetical protein
MILHKKLLFIQIRRYFGKMKKCWKYVIIVIIISSMLYVVSHIPRTQVSIDKRLVDIIIEIAYSKGNQ